jgi:hypothetical protein
VARTFRSGSKAANVLPGLLLMLSACAYWGPPPPETPAPPWDEDEASSEARYDPDVQIATRLLERLLRDRAVAHEHIDVIVDDGVVTLLGTVGDPQARERALFLAEGVEGVRAVHNRIHVDARAASNGHAVESDEP